MSVFFVKPEERTMDLAYESGGESHKFWVRVKARLNVGEQRRVMTAGWTTKAREDGSTETVVDFARQSLARTETYLTGWSFADDAGHPLAVTPQAIASLDPDVYDLIAAALTRHVEAMEVEKKLQSGSSAPLTRSA